MSDTPASERPVDGGWLYSQELPGGRTMWRLTQLVDGQRASCECMDDEGASEEQMLRELRETFDPDRVRCYREGR